MSIRRFVLAAALVGCAVPLLAKRPDVALLAPGVVYLHRKSGAQIVPMAICMSERRWPRRRYVVEIGDPLQIPESLDLESGASWLRERTLELYEQAKNEEMKVRE